MRFVLLASLLLAATTTGSAQQFEFPAGARIDTAALARYLPRLAAEVIAGYREPDRRAYLGNLFRLQAVAGRYAEAGQTLAAFAKALGDSASQETRAANILYAAYAAAMQQAPAAGSADDAARRELARVLATLDDLESAMAIRALAVSPGTLEGAVSGELRRQGERSSIALVDALRLVTTWQARAALRTLAAVAPSLVAEDDRRRYPIETIADAGPPLSIDWFAGSYIDLPVHPSIGVKAVLGRWDLPS